MRYLKFKSSQDYRDLMVELDKKGYKWIDGDVILKTVIEKLTKAEVAEGKKPKTHKEIFNIFEPFNQEEKEIEVHNYKSEEIRKINPNRKPAVKINDKEKRICWASIEFYQNKGIEEIEDYLGESEGKKELQVTNWDKSLIV